MTIFPARRRTAFLLRLLALSCLLLDDRQVAVADDWFQILDANHDGTLDRSEFNQGVSKFQAFLRQPLLEKAGAGGDTFFSRLFGGSLLSQKEEGAGGGSGGGAAGGGFTSLVGFWKAFTSAVAMILATEVGDKTFFIAAILSMKHSRCAVFGGAILALVVMTILSTAMGLVLPNFLSRQYTHYLSGALFLYFGMKLISEARQMEAGTVSEELEEVEEELMRTNNKKEEDDEEAPASGGVRSASAERQQVRRKSGKRHWYQVALQAFTLTFVAEWGDRSQIATIALAAAKNPIGVTVGGCLGHSICTGVAVVGGRMLAARIEEKTVHQYGGVIFLLFGLHSIFLEE